MAPAPPAAGASDLRAPYTFEKFVAQNDYFLGFYQSWTKTVLFLLGKHWLKWMDGPRRYSADTDVPPWRQQPVTNLVYSIYRTLDAKMSKQRPTFEVVPPSGDAEDREAAQLGEAVLQHLWRSLKLGQKARRARGWYFTTGQTYLRVWWDPKAGTLRPLTMLMEMTEDGYPVPTDLSEEQRAQLVTVDRPVPLDAAGHPVMTDDGRFDLEAQPAMVAEGDVDFGHESPMAVRFNADAQDPEDATEMYVARLWPKAKAAAAFGIAEQEIKGADDDDRKYYQDLIASGASGSGWLTSNSTFTGSLGADQSEAIGAQCLVLEYYAKPDPDSYPEGRHWITIGRDKVWPKANDAEYPTGEAPIPDGFWPPYIPVSALPVPGQPQAMGALQQVVPLNEQLNTLDGKIAEHEVTMAMGGKWVVGPEDEKLVIDSDPAQILKSKGYAAGRPPYQTQPKTLPSEIYNERNVLLEKVRMVLSLSEMDLGSRPEGVSAGRAFLVLQEVTDSVIAPDLEAWQQAWEEVGRRILVLVQRHYREERTIAIRGEKGRWEVRAFQGADLTDGLDVRVQVGSMFPWNKAAQLDTKLNVLSSFPDLVRDPDTGLTDPAKFAQYLDAGSSGLASFQSDEDDDLVEVSREHALFAAFDPDKGESELPLPGFWQAHAKHLDAHYRFLKRNRGQFDKWHPEAQRRFLAHCQQTATLVDQLAQQMVDASGQGPAAQVQAEDGTQDLPMDGMDPLMFEGMDPMAGRGAGPSASLERARLQPADFASAEG